MATITSITAGDGLSGGGTTGAVTLAVQLDGSTLASGANGVRLNVPFYRGDWTASTSYIVGDTVLRSGAIYSCKTANSDSTFDAGKWFNLTVSDVANEALTTVTGTANRTIASADLTKLIQLTGSTARTFTLPDVTSAGGWVVIDNSSSAVLTVDGAGSDTVDGFPNIKIPAGQQRRIFATSGTAWKSLGSPLTPVSSPADVTSPVGSRFYGSGLTGWSTKTLVIIGPGRDPGTQPQPYAPGTALFVSDILAVSQTASAGGTISSNNTIRARIIMRSNGVSQDVYFGRTSGSDPEFLYGYADHSPSDDFVGWRFAAI